LDTARRGEFHGAHFHAFRHGSQSGVFLMV
jgi:hypothetical protein